MAKKDRVFTPVSDIDRICYSGDRSHLYAMIAARMCSMQIFRSVSDGSYYAAARGERICANGWSDHISEAIDRKVAADDLRGLIRTGVLADFYADEESKIYDDVAFSLQKSPLPF